MLSWNIFHVPFTVTYLKDAKGKYQRHPNYPEDIQKWCTDNIRGRWTWGGSDGALSRPFYIEDKGDAMLFKLTWFERTQRPVFRR